MDRVTLTTDRVPEHERFALWREAALEGPINVVGSHASATPCQAQVTCWDGSAFRRLRYRSDAHLAFQDRKSVV